ncbi:hypothetical protein E1B28_000997 [Marasmius oreades]|uniref:BRCT domain-containing protein n=1 Tax=Marasmius oreades TaxID=181124 RepID=A0A9P7V2L0_9AGAR|nr:uncharacterized protein E1B28_000997 [Marasmius oreades]KAG7099124.1 hypothetical protein E1B28_000997 [Marasmius oreades]
MDSNTIEEKDNGSDMGDHSLLPPRRRNRGGTVPPLEESITQPSTASSSSLSDSSFPFNVSDSSQPNIIYRDSQEPPPSAGFVPPPSAIQKDDAMPSLYSLQSFGIPYSMQFPIGVQSASVYQPSLPSFVGNAPDQERFLMALADVLRHNLGSMQPNIEIPAPSTSVQSRTSTPIHSPDSPRGKMSCISRSPSPSVSLGSSSSSTPPDARNSLPVIISTPSDPSRIFESEDGSPLSFFVQIDMTNRGAIVSKIKTHGGIIKPNQADADYSILQSKSKIYKPLLESCVTANKLAVSMSFVHDCVEHGVLFDHTSFLLQRLPRRGRGKEKKGPTTCFQSSKSPTPGSYMKSSRSSVPPKSSSHSRLSARSQSSVLSLSAARFKSQNRPESPINPRSVVPSASRPQPRELSEAQEEQPVRIKKKKKITRGDQDKKEKSTKVKNASHKDEDEKAKHEEKKKLMKVADTNTKRTQSDLTHQSCERSPSPPPVHTRVQRADGKYQYPPIEKEYVLRYVQVLFGQDYEMGITTLAQKMHDKMPHHTFNSWLTTLNSGPMRLEIDATRKRAGILYRKNLHSGAQASAQSQGKARSGDAEIQRASKRRKTDEITTDDSVSEAQIQDDMKVLANFLMSRQSQVSDDEQDEKAFWALLTSQARCKTALSWKEFNQKHHHQILAKCESIAQSGDSLGQSIS